MGIGDRIKKRRIELNMSQEELAHKIGYKSRSTINKIELEINDITQSKIEAFAKALDTTPAYLMGWSDNISDEVNIPDIKPIELKKFRMLGNIACGSPIVANEEYGVYVEADSNIDADFCLKAQGDSMTGANIFDGDIVFIKEQSEVLNGKIAAILIEDEVTLKRIYIQDDVMTLLPANPNYAPLTYKKSDMLNIRILGRAVAVQSILK